VWKCFKEPTATSKISSSPVAPALSTPESRSTEDNDNEGDQTSCCAFFLHLLVEKKKNEDTSFFFHAGLKEDFRFSTKSHSVLLPELS